VSFGKRKRPALSLLSRIPKKKIKTILKSKDYRGCNRDVFEESKLKKWS
jgi:hypothetical protein